MASGGRFIVAVVGWSLRPQDTRICEERVKEDCELAFDSLTRSPNHVLHLTTIPPEINPSPCGILLTTEVRKMRSL